MGSESFFDLHGNYSCIVTRNIFLTFYSPRIVLQWPEKVTQSHDQNNYYILLTEEITQFE